jgi:hypothetical protein
VKSLEFLTEPSLLFFTALMKHKRRIFDKMAQHSSYVRFGKPNGVRVVSL